MNTLEIRLVTNTKELDQIYQIRTEVFVQEQQVPKDLEFDDLDNDSNHLIAKLNQQPIGCARIRQIGKNKAKLERIAILKPYRNKGYGTDITNYCINFCKTKHNTTLFLHAQTHVQKFYERFGFIEEGTIFQEAGIPHIKMIKNL
ncbi:MAG: GNAT family N-acetyltransferase [Euryarchaeota archaeon]|nr:GNAT family N-acetyltransferase [Euryarchaeota archaeon]